MCLTQGPQRSDAGEAQTLALRSRVKHSTTEPLRSLRTPSENHKHIGFLSNTGPDPPNLTKLHASIQCWAIIGLLAKRHLMAFRWRVDDSPI